MPTFPSREEFISDIGRGIINPVRLEIPLDNFNPAAAFAALRQGGYSFLLESGRVSDKTGRYSYIATSPYMVFKAKGHDVELVRGGKRAFLLREPLEKLRELMGNYRAAKVPGLPPFTGGCIGFFSYGLVHNFEKLPSTAVDDLKIPDAYFIFIDSLAVYDHIDKKLWLIANPGAADRQLGYILPEGTEWEAAYDRASARLTEMRAALEGMTDPVRNSHPSGGIKAEPLIPKEAYEEMVRRAKEYIATGDIFQANLSQRLSADIPGIDPWDIYLLLREVNPSPFAFYMDFPDLKMASCSPERLVRLSGGKVVSNVTGEIRPDKDAFDLVRASFPGGTVTGVPKVRCMEIIDELEPVTRGPYTGSAGWIAYTGDMDLNIIIRTFVIKDGKAFVQVGAGIVADSDPEREYYETLHKAEALVRTLEKL
jgi:anthranilate synthase component I